MKELFNGINKKLAALMVVSMIMYSLGNCIFYNVVVNFVVNAELSLIPGYVLILICVLIVTAVSEWIVDIYEEVIYEYLENDLNMYYLNKLYNIKPSVLKQKSTGYISSLVQKVVKTQWDAFEGFAETLLFGIVFIIYYSISLYMYNKILGISLVLTYIVSTLLRILYNKMTTTKVWSEYLEKYGQKNRTFIDFLSNINTIQKMQSKKFAHNKMKQISDEDAKLVKKAYSVDEPGFLIAKYSMYSYTIVALLIIWLFGDDSILYDASFTGILIIVSSKMNEHSRGIYKAIRNYGLFKGTLGKINEIVDDANIRQDIVYDELKEIEIVYCTYSYVDEAEKKKVTISIPYFDVVKGDFVCVYGESGQGKTTLLHILSKEIETNDVRLNGKFKDGRVDCAFVAQDTEILNLSLRDNLLLGRYVDDDYLIYMLRQVGLGEWFDMQEDGLDTMLGERGVFVSTGQRQRFNLIRGLLMEEKELFLLDEPTSNVDDDTEQKIVSLIKHMLKGKTVVIITHRPAIKEICNKFYVFEDGILKREC